ncbi:hypothetical protein FRC03_009606 [Tulasnella sp. 419]|nr:hypothetical protein FRC02_010703 [Tulasnella sp. 418]KAG8970333.1 hypothetical protein FRC03_009606 [Tulasnella sp. 419]
MEFITGILRRWTRNNGNSSGFQRSTEEYADSYGDFVPVYWIFWRRPRNDHEAQRLYNHVRTVAWYMDALPFLTKAGVPVKFGIDEIISAIPVYGDFLGFILSLYQIFLAWLFGVDRILLARMIVNIILDALLGVIPLIGDFLDVLFKANLRNLTLLEEWLLRDAPQFNIALAPSDVFLPRKRRAYSRANGSNRPEPDPRLKYMNHPRTFRVSPDDLDLD